MCFSSGGTSAPVTRAPYSLDNSQSAVTETVKDAPLSTKDAADTATTETAASPTTTGASGLRLPGMY